MTLLTRLLFIDRLLCILTGRMFCTKKMLKIDDSGIHRLI